jgi:DNA processing protein
MAALPQSFASRKAISPLVEMGAYEGLWMQEGASFKTIAEKFRAQPGALPSDLVLPEIAFNTAERAMQLASRNTVEEFGVRVHGAGEYPQKLRDAVYPVELLYYRGWWNFVEMRSVAVVGTRKPSPTGEKRAEKLVKLLVQDGFMVVSGLARGIDTVALTTAMRLGAHVAAVIGTPICGYYPPENQRLQDDIARNHLLISQVPIVRYYAQGIRQNRMFFPERNVTMSALTEATIIIEAGETSGTLTQARAAIQQGRKLFILDSCFQDPTLTWPATYEKRGAIRVREYEDIQRHLAATTDKNRRADSE